MAIRISTPVVKLLQDRGLLPNHCSKVELHIPPMGAMVIRYEVFVADEHLAALGDAFTQMAEEARAERVT